MDSISGWKVRRRNASVWAFSNVEEHETDRDLGLGLDTFRSGADREGRSEIPGQEPEA